MPSTEEVTRPSASRRKIEAMKTAANDVEVQDQNWILLHVFQLTRLLCDIHCPECLETGLSVNVCTGENAGFAAKLALRCDGCGYAKFEFSSPRIGDSTSMNVAFEANRRMTMFSHEIGGSHAALQSFSTVMGIPGMHLKTFQSHDKKVSGMFHFFLFLFSAISSIQTWAFFMLKTNMSIILLSTFY